MNTTTEFLFCHDDADAKKKGVPIGGYYYLIIDSDVKILKRRIK